LRRRLTAVIMSTFTIRKAGDEKDKTAMVSINWPQAVIRVQYTDMQVQESVTIEEANEGEK